jgi:hypothetical protein
VPLKGPQTPGAKDRRGRPPCAINSHELISFCCLSGSFWAAVEASYRSAERRIAHPHPRDREKELRSLGGGSPRPLLEVLREQLPSLLVKLRSLAGAFLGCRVPRSSSCLQ